jgi:hypothetical protein
VNKYRMSRAEQEIRYNTEREKEKSEKKNRKKNRK